jgi:hypothetical protein
MIRPRFHYLASLLIALAAIGLPSFFAQAEQPSATTPAPAEVKTAPTRRAKPQVIYHLPRTSSYAATLHSQAKTQSNALPIDRSVEPSLQMSRAPANEATPRAQQQQSAPKVNSSRQHRVKRTKLHSNPPQMRRQGPGKARGPGSSHGKKSGKK